MLAQSGLSKADNGDIQSCIVINDERYPDGKAIKGDLSSALIAPQISSLFFDKTYTRNTNSGHKVAVYQLKYSLPAYVFKEKFAYLDSFADDSMERKDLSIAITMKQKTNLSRSSMRTSQEDIVFSILTSVWLRIQSGIPLSMKTVML